MQTNLVEKNHMPFSEPSSTRSKELKEASLSIKRNMRNAQTLGKSGRINEM